jgi:hypothetical protein
MDKKTITCSDFCKLLEERDQLVAAQRIIIIQLFNEFQAADSAHRRNLKKSQVMSPGIYEVRLPFEV